MNKLSRKTFGRNNKIGKMVVGSMYKNAQIETEIAILRGKNEHNTKCKVFAKL